MIDQVTNTVITGGYGLTGQNYTVGQTNYFPVPYYPQSPPVITVPLPMVYPASPTQLSDADLEAIRTIVREEVHKALHGEEASDEPDRSSD